MRLNSLVFWRNMPTRAKLSKELIKRLKAVKSKRPRTVIEHIVQHGFITTEELRQKYGYNDPRRAAMDVRDQGIPIESFRVKGSDGRSIAAYRFGDLSQIRRGFLGGRRAFSKVFKDELVAVNGCRCYICLQPYEQRYLQIDHRIPYQVHGDVAFEEQDIRSYALLCGSCNRAKSWSCEHCPNFTDLKLPATCAACYWTSPEAYEHVATRDARRLEVVWLGEGTQDFDRLKVRAVAANEDMPEYVRRVLRNNISRK